MHGDGVPQAVEARHFPDSKGWGGVGREFMAFRFQTTCPRTREFFSRFRGFC